MSSRERALDIRNHQLVPADKEDDSVTRWRCLDCGRESPCASDFLDDDCGLVGGRPQ